mgnify:CR=1 FL=1
MHEPRGYAKLNTHPNHPCIAFTINELRLFMSMGHRGIYDLQRVARRKYVIFTRSRNHALAP